ncbi:hypothetical protein EMPG_15833 [Blastomyces silverae]|uniref:Uncharacterized protein n=1 Tax=Blastomyces silverae TaxID=2060906 RepID=A0A0H1BC82_9EURO|nr:hypothetical protein EMPG_15833 [Blastomyces silverae]
MLRGLPAFLRPMLRNVSREAIHLCPHHPLQFLKPLLENPCRRSHEGKRRHLHQI